MAYQNVGTPRFYVSWADYWKSLGMQVDSLHTLNQSQAATTITASAESSAYYGTTLTPYKSAGKGIDFFAVLGHNVNNPNLDFIAKLIDSGINQEVFLASGTTITGVNTDASTRVSGFTLGTFPEATSEVSGVAVEADAVNVGINNNNTAEESVEINSFVFGKYYDMPHSPDLNLKLSYEYDGVKTMQTKGGATLSNSSYYKPADWGSMGCWQLGDNPNYRSGRRVWDLSFSYLSDNDIMPLLAATTNYESTYYTSDENYQEVTLLDGADFFSRVWNRTLGGHLPFIFQPDGNNNNPDQFAIARFDMNSLTYDQVANNVYNVKLKIRESW